MVDTRFHPFAGPVALRSLLASLPTPPLVEDGRLDQIAVAGADELETADSGEIALAARPDYREALRGTSAGVVIVHPRFRDLVPPGVVPIVVERAHELFVDILERLYPVGMLGGATWQLGSGDAAPLCEEEVRIGPNAVIGSGVEIGRNTVIGPNSVIGRGVTIGRNAVIGANVTVEYAHLGNGVVLHPGARVGTEGFGWLGQGRRNRKIPQLGRVIVQDGVEIGANTTVDRGALGDTVIGEGTKIDNLVQIAHNARVGRNCLFAAMSGVAGGTIVGDGVMFGGGSATSGHMLIGDGCVVSAYAYVTKDVPAGTQVGGYPARELSVWRREQATVRRLNRRGLE